MERLIEKKQLYITGFMLYTESSDDDLCEINDLIRYLKKAKENGATHIQEGGSWGDYEIMPVKFEIESDEDYAKRLIDENENRKKQKEEDERK